MRRPWLLGGLITAPWLAAAQSAWVHGRARPGGPIAVPWDRYLLPHRQHAARLAAAAAKGRLPAMYGLRSYAEAGGLMAYLPDLVDNWRRAAGFVDKILKGTKRGELPVEPPTRFELVINLKTARALGMTVPPSLLPPADEVIP